jgi:hypothetical protein
MSDANLRDPLRLGEWQPLGEAFAHISERLITTNGLDFLLHNWDCKYLNARIDMRSGSILLSPGAPSVPYPGRFYIVQDDTDKRSVFDSFLEFSRLVPEPECERTELQRLCDLLNRQSMLDEAVPDHAPPSSSLVLQLYGAHPERGLHQWTPACDAPETGAPCTRVYLAADVRAKATADIQRAWIEKVALKRRIEELGRMDREAAEYVESVICMRTGFNGEPPYVGWKGLGLALREALDERDELRREVEQVRRNYALLLAERNRWRNGEIPPPPASDDEAMLFGSLAAQIEDAKRRIAEWPPDVRTALGIDPPDGSSTP